MRVGMGHALFPATGPLHKLYMASARSLCSLPHQEVSLPGSSGAALGPLCPTNRFLRAGTQVLPPHSRQGLCMWGLCLDLTSSTGQA